MTLITQDGIFNCVNHGKEGYLRNWIITGCTGFIGRELIYFLLTTTQDHLSLLVRPHDVTQHTTQRIAQQLYEIDPTYPIEWNRIRVVSADVTLPKLGLSESTIETLLPFDNIFVHLAANTNFADSIDHSRSINLEGTRNALQIAEQLFIAGRLSVFGYVSTCYVHGSLEGVVNVAEPLRPQNARNTYECSKCEAELEVRSALSKLPIVIFRPSIVVGESVSGRASGTNTIYWAVKRYLEGHRIFLARQESCLDIVPVDFVVTAICVLLQQTSNVGKCFPLTSGVGRGITVGHFAKQIATYCNLPIATLINPGNLSRVGGVLNIASASVGKRLFMKQMLAYLPYFTSNPHFDNSETIAALGDAIGKPPHFDSYSDELFQYCLDKGWSQQAEHQTVT